MWCTCRTLACQSMQELVAILDVDVDDCGEEGGEIMERQRSLDLPLNCQRMMIGQFLSLRSASFTGNSYCVSVPRNVSVSFTFKLKLSFRRRNAVVLTLCVFRHCRARGRFSVASLCDHAVWLCMRCSSCCMRSGPQ